MPIKQEIEHRDCLGRILAVGDCVAYPDSNSLCIGVVKKLHPKMVNVKKLSSKSKWGSQPNKYPNDLVKLEGNEVSMYLLKNSD